MTMGNNISEPWPLHFLMVLYSGMGSFDLGYVVKSHIPFFTVVHAMCTVCRVCTYGNKVSNVHIMHRIAKNMTFCAHLCQQMVKLS